jgi:thiamine biosynthesis lipoprotein
MFYRMDTSIEVTLVTPKADARMRRRIETAWRGIDSLFLDWETRFSQTTASSEVLAANRRTGNQVRVSPAFARIINCGVQYGARLNGLFDITILPIKELWGFSEQEQRSEIPVPADSAVQRVKAAVDFHRVNVDTLSRTVTFADTSTRIDMGGIAKAFALVDLQNLLDSLGFKDYLICEGGDIMMRGRREDGKPWRIAIKHPRTPEAYLASFEIDSGAVVTSGDYERFWVKDGKRVCHIFNPRTGYSCTANRSVTMWGMDMVDIDIVSTALFCLPADSILAYVESRPALECAVVDSAGGIHISRGWKNKLTLY